MKNIKWVSFCASNKVLKTVIHFFPKVLNVATQYPVICKLGLFGEGKDAGTVMVDGVRINQASGILLDTAFPSLNGDYAGFIGLSIEFSLRQQSPNFEKLSSLIELVSFSSSTHFYPTLVSEEEKKRAFLKSFPVLFDTLSEPSLLLVNSTLTEFRTNVLNVENTLVVENLQSLPLTAKEYTLDGLDNFNDKSSVFNSCWTNGYLSLLRFDSEIPAGVGVYILCRDKLTRKITSCFSL
ncbi:MAG: hypothetical protein ACOX3T_06160 [Bdellovibrionota bacterium]